ncbi:hypothetical protein HPB48_022295 [Haemaphysalis longicornis]|uniref:Amidohydrolase n=1 Tax=Haemaphysalis longicornis TaxID=44386 RepID=A0A9J6FY73_HAELO|nr:hypothetical protein HPB48_022295 [Haemaphysalis longicornis]
MAEYDALPKLGHGCGHNLIAESSVGAALAVMAAMKLNPAIRGKVFIPEDKMVYPTLSLAQLTRSRYLQGQLIDKFIE